MQAHDELGLAPEAIFLDRYEILEKLGEGGFGRVFRARQLSTRQEVAVKLMRPGLEGAAEDNTRQIARFQREMRICASLYHPNIVRLVDSGQTSTGALYTVFEYVPGKNLAELLREEGRMSPAETSHVMGQVLDALSCAHARGVVHRDLKPHNIMITRTGTRRNAMVLDFGIGAIVDPALAESTRLTMSNEGIGTPAYSAPEQLRGEPTNARADLYAWALIFIECLTGHRLMDGRTLHEVLFKQLGADPVPVPEAVSRGAFGAMLRQALAKNVEERTVSADDLLGALERVRPDDLLGQGELGAAGGRAGEISGGTTPETLVVGRGRPTLSLQVGERKQLTALCCALTATWVGPAEPSIEEVDEALDGLQRACAEVAARHDGQVVSALGDRLLIYFGYPVADENTGRRAATAALEILETVEREGGRLGVQRGLRVTARVGLHTGLVVAHASESSPSGLTDVAGLTPRLAADLLESAEPGVVVVSEATRRLLERRFLFEAAGTVHPAYLPRAVEVWRLGEMTQGGDTFANLGTARTPMVGRETDVELLLGRWQAARGGQGQSLLVIGEPGLGKSRLLDELSRRLSGQVYTRLAARCAPESRNDPLRAITELFRRMAGIGRDETTEQAQSAVEALLTRHGLDLAEMTPLFAGLLNLPIPARYVAPDVMPQRLKQLTLNAILQLFAAMADQQPLLVIVEDLHWADPTTLELLGLLAEEVGSARILVVMTTRPEFVSPWPASRVSPMHLGRLDRPEIERLIRALTGDRELPRELLDRMIERSDGVPLFVEEIVHMVVVGGALDATGDPERIGHLLRDLSIPETLRDLLTARLDRLGKPKDVAQLAAVIGREFSFELLSAVSTRPEAQLLRDLDALVGAELVVRRRRLREVTYTFRHALIRDTAYESLPRASRRQLHAEVAATIERQFPSIARHQPELLIHHHAAAEQLRQAVAYALPAAQGSMMRSANQEAIHTARQALGWLDALADPDERDRQELALNGVVLPAIMATRGWGDPEIIATAARSQEILERHQDSQHVLATLWALSTFHHIRGDRESAMRTAEHMLRLTEASGDLSQRVAVLPVLGGCLVADGKLKEAQQILSLGATLYDVDAHRSHGWQYGMDSKAYCLMVLTIPLWQLGYPETALREANHAVAWARETQHAATVALALIYLAIVQQQRGDREATAATCGEILEMAGRHGLMAQAAYTSLLLAWATGNPESAHPTLAVLDMLGCALAMPYYRSVVAEAEAARGNYAAALALIDRAIEQARTTREVYFLPEALRMRAEWMVAQDPATRAEALALLDPGLAQARDAGALTQVIRTLYTRSRLLEGSADAPPALSDLADALSHLAEGRAEPPFSDAIALVGGAA